MLESGPSGAPGVLRRLNRNHVLRVVRAEGPVSRGCIASLTGLSRPTVNDVVAELMAAGLVADTIDTSAPKRPGPRAHLVRFRADTGYVLGIDIGAAKSVVQLANLSGEVVARHRIGAAGLNSRADVLVAIRSSIDRVCAEASVELEAISAVAVGTPGIVDPQTGALSLAPQLPDWEGIVLAEELDPRIGASIQAENEVHLAVLGERWLGAAREAGNAVYFHIGVGIGLGVLIEGHLHRGSAGAAGEIGYLPIVDADAERPEGVGVLEHAASGAAFARRGREAAHGPDGQQLRELAGGDPDAVDAQVVFEAARKGDPVAQAIVADLVDLLARAAATVCLVLNPETVILGGGISQAGRALADPLEQRLSELVPAPPTVHLSELGDLAVAQGAVRLALDTVDERIYELT